MSTATSATQNAGGEASIIDAVDRLLDLKLPDHVQPSAFHLFAHDEPPLQALREIAQTAFGVSVALGSYQGLVLTEPKTVAGLRQQSSDARTLHTNAASIKATIDALRAHLPGAYGEDIPLDRDVLPWLLQRLEVWCKAVGMDFFHDPAQNDELTCLMAGKIIVVDIVFTIRPAKATTLKSLKLSYASATEGSTSSPLFIPDESDPSESYTLDKSLFEALGAFVEHVQKGGDTVLPDASHAAKLGETFRTHLKYLVKLDALASSGASGEHSMQWLNGVHTVAQLSWGLSRAEAELTRSLLKVQSTPLDIFLVRSHALPLPYLKGANISFLAHVSPLAYMRLVRTLSPSSSDRTHLFDVPLSVLRDNVQRGLPANASGFTVATLSLHPALSDPAYAYANVYAVASRPSFDPQLVLPSELQAQPSYNFPEDPSSTFMLTIEGQGIVMAESRMREIQRIVGISSSLGSTIYDSMLPSLRFGWPGSWVDMLLQPTMGSSPESYIATYNSPRELHPPVKLRLRAPAEVGFVLSRVPVKSLQQVWAILEIVREQAWINELLQSCDWLPDVGDVGIPDYNNFGDQTLEALLTGTYSPDSLPVHVSLPSPAPALGVEESPPSRPMLRMVVPLQRRPGEAMAPRTSVVTLAMDPSRPRGVRVEVNNTLVESLDEPVRRGGGLGIGGRLWAGLVNG